MHNDNIGQLEEKFCISCNASADTAANPLVPLASCEEGECIHLHCARLDCRFGFCWCCRETVVYYSDDLNEAGECATHDGESVPDYPEEDADSYVENIRNNEN